MAKTDQELATEAAERAHTAVNEPRDPRTVRSSIKAAAQAARNAIPAGAGKLNEPAIASSGAAVVPRTGAAPDSGQAPKPGTGEEPKPGTGERTILLVDEDEYDELQRQAEGGEGAEGTEAAGEGEAAAEGAEGAEGEGEAGAEGEGEGEAEGEEGAQGWITVTLPGRTPDDAPRTIDVEDPELAAELVRLNRGYANRSQLAVVMEDVNAAREEQAQLEDALALDPTNYLIDRVRPELRIQHVRELLAEPGVFDAIANELGGLEGDALRLKLTEIRNERLTRRTNNVNLLQERSTERTQGRKLDTAIRQIIPDEMDRPTADRLYRDLFRDLTEYVAQNRGRAVPVGELPGILAWRLEQYGISQDYAVERLEETGLPPLPNRARAARTNGANGRNGAPVRTGQQVVEQAARRRAAAAVPGSGAGVPAQGAWVVPKKGGGIRGMISALREVAGLGK